MKCPICQKDFKCITVQHVRKHCSVEEFKQKFPEVSFNSTAINKVRALAKERAETDQIRCINPGCNKLIISTDRKHRKFCSQNCSAIFNNKKRGKKEKRCVNCNCQISYNNTSGYCTECKSEIRYLKNTKLWLEGAIPKDKLFDCDHSPTVKGFIRKYLFSEFNNKCQKCNWGEINEETKSVPLQIHHIDGDCKNNQRNNLQILCPNCHSLTNNFGRLNKKSKRKTKYADVADN
jgi:hypothetical protein